VKRYKVWQDGNHIHNNPVAEEFVDEADHWLYSSARDYYGTRKGLLEIDFVR